MTATGTCAPGTWASRLASLITPSGAAGSYTGTSRSAVSMNEIHTGSDSPPPVSRSPSERGVSYPIQTTAATVGWKPANQVSTASLVVPVLP